MQQRYFCRLQAWMPYFLRDPVHDERQAAVTRVFEVLSGWVRGGSKADGLVACMGVLVPKFVPSRLHPRPAKPSLTLSVRNLRYACEHREHRTADSTRGFYDL